MNMVCIRGGSTGLVKKVSTISQFDAELVAAGGNLVIVDFTASWCGPCKTIAPVYDSMASSYQPAVFIKVDVDELPELAQKYNVMSMPTFLFIKDGKEVDRFSGASVQKLQDSIEALI